MDRLKADIAIYLTIGGQVFIAPQYDIEQEADESGTRPDFVALDFSCNEIVVVEVAGAADAVQLATNIENRQRRWFNPVRKNLLDKGVVTAGWHIRFLGFVRDDLVEKLRRRFEDTADVAFYPVGKATILRSCRDERIKMGLPGHSPRTRSASAWTPTGRSSIIGTPSIARESPVRA